MLNEFSRQEILIGKEKMQLIKNTKVVVIGIGGVGGYVVEGLIRAGIENIVLVDDDNVSLTNINRQIHANHATIGRPKVEVMQERIIFINKNAKVKVINSFVTSDNMKEIIGDADYIVDAIDTVKSKIDIIRYAKYKKIPIISCMGTGNKIEPTMLKVADISKTKMCPLAKVMRKELKKYKIEKLKVVYSEEEPLKVIREELEEDVKAGSFSFVPSVAGMIIASEVIKDIIDFHR